MYIEILSVQEKSCGEKYGVSIPLGLQISWTVGFSWQKNHMFGTQAGLKWCGMEWS